ncbi:hypothetical protein BT69DRAFT_1260815 [Atractiella rhizophila]|nr:hypothetical protein BT69DRAFT_1260815 [Atractiella rhizophila]
MAPRMGWRPSLQGNISFLLRSQPRVYSFGAPYRPPNSSRFFHSSRPRNDIIFVTVPAFKSALLSLTRGALVILPFWYRWQLGKRFPRTSRMLFIFPLFAVCIIIAIGIDQSPRTARWRLLLMSEREEMEWSQKRFEEFLQDNQLLILPPSDPRVAPLKEIAEKLIGSLTADTHYPVSCARWPKDVEDVSERIRALEERLKIEPSAKTNVALMPFRPETANPEKVFGRDWDIFVVDLPKVNAFVLPTKELVIYTGLLNLLQNDEDLLAAVLAHEISHVTERHAVENMGFLALSSVVFDVLRGVSWALTVSFPVVTDALGSVFNFLDQVVTQRSYSRKLETEADMLGLEVMAKAGYHPQAAVVVWEILNEMDQELHSHGNGQSLADKLPFLRSHPPGPERIQNIEKHMPIAMKLFDEYQAKNRPKQLPKEMHSLPTPNEMAKSATSEIRKLNKTDSKSDDSQQSQTPDTVEKR